MTDPKLLSGAEFEALVERLEWLSKWETRATRSIPARKDDYDIIASDAWNALRAERAARVKAEAERDVLREHHASYHEYCSAVSTQGPSSNRAPSPEAGQPGQAPEASASLPLGHVFIQHHKGPDYYSGCVSTDLSKMAYCGQPRSAHLPTPPPSPQDEERKRLVEELRGESREARLVHKPDESHPSRCPACHFARLPCEGLLNADLLDRAADLLERDAKPCSEFVRIDGIYPYCANCGQDRNRHPA